MGIRKGNQIRFTFDMADLIVSESQIAVASNDDLLVQILLRLPLRPLTRFASVSKRWNSLISDPKFRLAFGKKDISPAAGLILQSPSRYRSAGATSAARHVPFVVWFDKPTTRPQILASGGDRLTSIWGLDFAAFSSCNGLLICGSNDNQVVGRHPRQRYYVCNPTTGEYRTLPKLDWWKSLEGISLAFDPSMSAHYSVVCVWRLDPDSDAIDGRYELEVFSSETGSWSKSGEPFTSCVNFRHGVYWNGSIHWMGIYGKSIYFNPDDGRTPPKAMPSPPLRPTNFTYPWPHYYFRESGGHLNYIADCYKWDTVINIHEMRNDYSEWFVKYRVGLHLTTITDLSFSIQDS